MTLLSRAAILAVLSAGILGLSGISVPTIAAQAATDAIGADAARTPYIAPLPLEAPVAPAQLTAPTAADEANRAAIETVEAEARFASLAAAVAGQDMPDGVSDELRCLAGAIYYESKSEPLAGQLAVAEVIINRARSGRYPKSLCGVVTQAGQFSFVRGGAVPAINPALQQWKTAVAVAQVALDEDWESPASNAMFFHARHVRPGWSKARVASIGNHVFYR